MTDRKLKVRDIIEALYVEHLTEGSYTNYFTEEFHTKFGKDIVELKVSELLSWDNCYYGIINLLTAEDEEVVIASGRPKYSYWFAKYVKGANIRKLQKAVTAIGNPKYCFRFAFNVKGADISMLKLVEMK